MRKSVVIGILWIATLVLVWFLGSSTGPQAARSAAQPREGQGAAPVPEARVRHFPVADFLEEEATEPEEPSGAGVVEKLEPFTFENITSIDQASTLFMKFAKRKLDEGPGGHLELYRILDQVAQDNELQQRLFRNEEEMIRHLYPWVKFLVDNDQKVVGMLETLYRTAAETPEWFEGTDNDTLEPFTEGLAILLPSAVSEETLERFRGHVQRILERPKESLPKALQRNVRDFQRNLKYWAPPLAGEDLVMRLLDPNVSAVEKLELVQRVDPKDLAGIDVVGFLAEALRGGNRQAVWALRNVPVSGADIARLDSAVLDGAAAGGLDAWNLSYYVRQTNRRTWDAARPFIESGLQRGGNATNAFAQCLAYLQEKPSADYVQRVVDAYNLDQATVSTLKTQFKLN
ncbi:MAG: hypothetical protein ACYSX0_15455 [Planctomycetota bacterium]|jgi:hypothetical protein